MIRTVADLLANSPNKKRGLVVVNHLMTIEWVASVLNENSVNIVVVTKDGVPVGVISTSDINNEVANGENLSERHAYEVMTEDIVTTFAAEEIMSVSKIMTDNNIRHIIVIDKDMWVEVLSIKDVLSAITANEKELEETFEMYKQSGWPPVS
jgi:predicted transcriptional regulator